MSDAEGVFIFFEDFEGSTLNSQLWDVDFFSNPAYAAGSAQVSVSDSKLTLRSFAGSRRQVWVTCKESWGTCGMRVKLNAANTAAYSWGMAENRCVADPFGLPSGMGERFGWNSEGTSTEGKFFYITEWDISCNATLQGNWSTLTGAMNVYFANYYPQAYKLDEGHSYHFDNLISYDVPTADVRPQFASGTMQSEPPTSNDETLDIDWVLIKKCTPGGDEPYHADQWTGTGAPPHWYRGPGRDPPVQSKPTITISGDIGIIYDGIYNGQKTTVTSPATREIVHIGEPKTTTYCPSLKNVILDGSKNAARQIGIIIENTYAAEIENVTITNCDIGIMVINTYDPASNPNGLYRLYAEATKINVDMQNVRKGIVFKSMAGSKSFAYTYIENADITLRSFGTDESVGIEMGASKNSVDYPENWINYDSNNTIYGGLINAYIKLNTQNSVGLKLNDQCSIVDTDGSGDLSGGITVTSASARGGWALSTYEETYEGNSSYLQRNFDVKDPSLKRFEIRYSNLDGLYINNNSACSVGDKHNLRHSMIDDT
jgi:hypothetical protein